MNIATADAHGGNAVNSVAFSPDGQLLATVGNDKKLITWNCMTSQMQKEFDLSGKGICVAFTSGGNFRNYLLRRSHGAVGDPQMAMMTSCFHRARRCLRPGYFSGSAAGHPRRARAAAGRAAPGQERH